MSITDELREFAPHLDLGKVALAGWKEALLAIADRIDAEHERQCAESWMRGHDAWAAIDRSDAMAEHGWVRLPVDADGEPIHIGDVMAYADNTKPMEVVALVPPAVFLTEDGPRYADMCRHYHAPTVEDVLRQVIACANNGMHVHGALDTEQIVAEYAVKLQLREDA